MCQKPIYTLLITNSPHLSCCCSVYQISWAVHSKIKLWSTFKIKDQDQDETKHEEFVCSLIVILNKLYKDR